MDVINTSGRRKTSVARIYMKPGKGEVTVNKRPVAEYFTTGTLQYKINQPSRSPRPKASTTSTSTCLAEASPVKLRLSVWPCPRR